MPASNAASLAAPPNPEITRQVQSAVSGLTPAELTWISGYVAGLAAIDAPASVTAAGEAQVLTILYGSQTGNGRGVAEALADRVRQQGFDAKLTSLADFKPSDLKREKQVALVISTHGEGDPPDDADLFHEYLLSTKAPRLDDLKFSVLALGDSSYANFCQTGREFDQRLAELGATRLAPIVECDVDFDAQAAAWSEALLEQLPELLESSPAGPHLFAVDTAVQYDRQHPFVAEVLVNQKITGKGSSKDVRHIELSLEDSGLRYEPGDALAVIADNPPQLVAQLGELLGIDPSTEVSVDDETMSFGEALRGRVEITSLSLGFLQSWADFADSGELRALLAEDRRSELGELLDTHQVIDVARRFPADVSAQRFVDSLRKLSPRSYSIASSQAANPDEVHLTVAAVRYDAFGSEHWGAASTMLADRVEAGDTVRVYVETNPRFRLPDDDALPVIMIGPGTGVAPFRAFVEERAERGAGGASWLFFGDRTMQDDFLYQLEWQRHLKQGRLARLDVAFSRDQAHKVYVQDRIREHGADVYEWIEQGAAIYVCGDAKHMAGDVHDALVDVIAQHGELERDAAEQRLKELRRAGRYQRDVY